MKAMQQYLEQVKGLVEAVADTQAQAMEQAADAVAKALMDGGMVYTFGTGHSHILAEEIFYRAGGLAKVYPILDAPLMLHTAAARSSEMERLSGYAKLLLDDCRNIRQGDILFLFSNSGRNTVAIEMAEEARKRGMVTVCITNLTHSKSVTSRHPSGLRLFEACDIVIDNLGAVGDACVNIRDVVCGPTSTAIGAMIMQAIVCAAVEKVYELGGTPEVFLSGNIDGGDEYNHRYIERYSPLIKML